MNPLQPLDFKQYVIDALNAAFGGEIRVTNAHPTQPDLLPCVSVQQASGGLEEETIGQQLQPTYRDPATGIWYELEGGLYRQGVQVTVWSWHPEQRDDLAKRLRFALWRIRKRLSDDEDVHNGRLTEQGDGQDFEQDAPQDVFMFIFELTGLVPLVEATPLKEPASTTIGAVWDQALDDEDEDDE